MKPPRFDYAVPATVEEALALLNGGAEEARPLAGGQSLVPLLNMRFARPTLLVDLGRVAELDGIAHVDGHVRIGAMTRQRALERDDGIRRRFPLLTEATELIAHVAIRTRGTVGGSLAHADPAAELPAAAMALDARFVIRTAGGGRRTVPAAEFFLGPFTTAVEPGELLEAVELDAPPAGTGSAFVELTRVHGAFALVGVAALVGLGTDGTVARARLALCGGRRHALRAGLARRRRARRAPRRRAVRGGRHARVRLDRAGRRRPCRPRVPPAPRRRARTSGAAARDRAGRCSMSVTAASELRTVELTVNGRAVSVRVEPRTLLADVLREQLELRGVHLGCEHGICGACTILVGGEPARSCLMLAVQADGLDLTTVEALARGPELHPMQRAFQERHGLQCGFCTPGFLLDQPLPAA